MRLGCMRRTASSTAPVDVLRPRRVEGGPPDHASGQCGVGDVVDVLGGLRDDGAEGVHREQRARGRVEEPGRHGAVVQRRAHGPEGAVADRHLVAGPDGVHPVQGDRPPRGHAHGAQGVGDELGVGRQLHHPLEVPGVVGVVVGEPDPAEVRDADDRVQRGEEVVGVDVPPGVDQNRLGGMEHEGVDGEDAALHGRGGGQDVDVGRRLVGSLHPGLSGGRPNGEHEGPLLKHGKVLLFAGVAQHPVDVVARGVERRPLPHARGPPALAVGEELDGSPCRRARPHGASDHGCGSWRGR